MESIPCNRGTYAISLANSDGQLLQIEELIDAKRRILIDKQHKLKSISKQNQFLDTIKNDYAKYYGYISQQKREQVAAFEMLNSYISDLTRTGKLTKYNISDAKHEQDKIMHEITSIRKGLDGLMDSANYISSKI